MTMRCFHCRRDYPEGSAFCHQCGEALQAHEPSAGRSPSREQPAASALQAHEPPGERSPGREQPAASALEAHEPSAGRSPSREQPAASASRARAMARRRAPVRSQSFVFAAVVVLGAITGLAIVSRQAWMPSRASVAAKPPGPENPLPAPTAAAPVPAPAPVEAQSAPPAPLPTPAPERVTNAVTAPPAARTPEPAPVATPAPVAKRAPDPAAPPPPKTATRPEPPAATERPATSPPKLLSARTDPGTAIPAAGARVVSLVAVGSAPRARGQLLWEPLGGGTLVVSGLPQPPAGRTYQLWLGSIDLGNRVSAGLLAVDAQGAGTLRVSPPRSTWSPDIFGVTVERQGGAREPSDNLVLVGEMPKLQAAAPPAPIAPPPAESPAPDAPAPAPTTTASLPSPVTRGPDGQFVRVFPATQERSWLVAQSVLKSLGWDIDSADHATGVIRTEPRNVTFKDFVVYAEGTRHTVSVVVRSVSSSETSISVRRDVFEEQRIFWAKERKLLPTPESSVEQKILDAIERLL